MANVTLLGTGLIGAGMAQGFLRRGDRVTVWNRTPEKARALEAHGARVADTIEAAVQGADRVHVVVSDDAAVDAILAKIPGGARLVLDHSTTSPQGTVARAERSAARGLSFLHAPIFMSPAGARESKGMILVAGPRARFEPVEPELAKMATKVWWVGERVDLAAVYKLCGNMMILSITAGLSDVYRFARTLGVEPVEAHALFGHFDASGTIKVRGLNMAKGDFAPSFETTMARKDLRLMHEACDALQLVPAIERLLDRAIAEGHGSEDVAAIAAVAPVGTRR